MRPHGGALTGMSAGERGLRVALAAVFFFGASGTLIELVLLEHFDETVQYAPFAAVALAAVALGWALARPGRRAIRAVRWTGLLLVAVGLVGSVLHFRSNVLFELEMDPGSAGLALAWIALRGATPSLAPGQLAQLGLIAFLFTLGHPALRGSTLPGENP